MNTKCEKCGGRGKVYFEEDGRNVSDMCYRCAGSGKVDEETAHHTQLEQVAHIVGTAYVQAWRKACNEDPEGEGWVFRAAENMMSEHDYTSAMMYEKSAEVGEELAKLSHFAQVALIEALLPKAPTPAAEGVKEPSSDTSALIEGFFDIPF